LDDVEELSLDPRLAADLEAVFGCKPDPSAVPLEDLIAYDAGCLNPEKRKWVEDRLKNSLRAVDDLCRLREAKRLMDEDAKNAKG